MLYVFYCGVKVDIYSKAFVLEFHITVLVRKTVEWCRHYVLINITYVTSNPLWDVNEHEPMLLNVFRVAKKLRSESISFLGI